jgi:succinyl-CoA synthetase beta subunit
LIIGPGGVDIEKATGQRHTLLLNTDKETQGAYALNVEASFNLLAGTVQPIIHAVGRLLRTDRVTELDINPMVRSSAGGLIALDALVVVERAG